MVALTNYDLMPMRPPSSMIDLIQTRMELKILGLTNWPIQILQPEY